MSGKGSTKSKRSKSPSSKKDSKLKERSKKDHAVVEDLSKASPVISDDQWSAMLFVVDGEAGYEGGPLEAVVRSGLRKKFTVLVFEELLGQVKDKGKDPLLDEIKGHLHSQEAIPDPLIVRLLQKRLFEDRVEGILLKEEQRREAALLLEEQAERERQEREAMQRALRGETNPKLSAKKDKKGKKKGADEKSEKGDKKDSKAASRASTPDKKKDKKSKDKDGKKKKGGAGPDPNIVARDDEPADGPDVYYMLAGFPLTFEFAQCLQGERVPLGCIVRLVPTLESFESTLVAMSRSVTSMSRGSPDLLRDKKDKKDKKDPKRDRRKQKDRKRGKGKDKSRKVEEEVEVEPEAPPDIAALAEQLDQDTPDVVAGWSPALLWLQHHIKSTPQDSPLRDIVWVEVRDASRRTAESIFDEAARHMFDTLQKKPVHAAWLSSMDVHVVSSPREEVPMQLYHQLLDQAPPESVSVPLILHCMLEQVVASQESTSGPTSGTERKMQEEEMKGFLDKALTSLTLDDGSSSEGEGPPLDTPTNLTIIRHGDAIGLSAAMRPSNTPPGVDACGEPVPVLMIEDAERSVQACARVPGRGRTHMPPAAAKDEVERRIEKNELYTFTVLSPPMVERFLMLEAFEDLLGRHASPWHLAPNYCYYEELDADVLSQVLLDARKAGPTAITRYHARDDVLLVALLPLMSRRRVASSAWESQFRCKLAFGAFIAAVDSGADLFDLPEALEPFDRRPPVVVEEVPVQTSLFSRVAAPSSGGGGAERRGRFFREDTPPREPTPPPPFARDSYEVGDALLRVSSSTASMYPADGAVMHASVITTKDTLRRTSTVHLNGCSFALHREERVVPPPVEEESYDERELIKEEEEQEEDEEKSKSKSGSGGQIAEGSEVLKSGEEEAGDTVSSIVFGTNTVLPHRLSAFSASFPDGSVLSATEQTEADVCPGHVCVVYTPPSGAMCQVGLDGVVQQSYAYAATRHLTHENRRRMHPAREEAGRCIFGNGSVIRYLNDGRILIYYRNGNTAVYDPYTETSHGTCVAAWVSTNSKGAREGSVLADSSLFYVPPVDVTDTTDPERGDVLTTRSDGVRVMRHRDGRMLASFPDGTVIESDWEEDTQTVTVTCDAYAAVVLELKDNTTTTHLLDGSVIRGSLSAIGVEKDGAWVHVSRGVIVCGTSTVPYKTFCNRDRPGKEHLYTFNYKLGTVSTQDSEKNSFVINRDSTTQVMLYGEETNPKAEHARDSEDEESDAGNVKESESACELPLPSLSHPPRLFIIRPDGSGTEILTEAAGAEALRAAEGEALATVVAEDMHGEDSSTCFTIMEQLTDRVVKRRQFTRHSQLLDASINEVHDAMERYAQWKEQRVEFGNTLNVADQREAALLRDEAHVRQQIKEERERHRLFLQSESARAANAMQAEDESESEEKQEEQASLAPVLTPRSARNRRAAKSMAERKPTRGGVEFTENTSGAPPSYFDSYFGAQFLENQSRVKIGSASGGPPMPPSPVNTFDDAVARRAPRNVSDSDDDDVGDLPPADPNEDFIETYSNAQAHPVDRSSTETLPPVRPLASPSIRQSKERVDFMGNSRKLEQISVPATHLGGRGVPNERFSRVEGPVRRSVKTSSMRRRLQSQSSHDSMFGFQIYPEEVAFGVVRAGGVFRSSLTLTNVGVELCRVRVKAIANPCLRVVYKPGPVAAGQSVKMEVEISIGMEAEINEIVEVETEAQIFRVPVTASVVSREQFALISEASGGRQPLRAGVRETHSRHGRKPRKTWKIGTDSGGATVIPPIRPGSAASGGSRQSATSRAVT